MDPNRRPITSRDNRWVQALARWLAARGISPNAISSASMACATLGAGCYWFVAEQIDLMNHHVNGRAVDGCLLGAALCIQLRLLCNVLDGLVAVEGGRKGKAGLFFNEAPDRYADVILLAAAGYAVSAPALGWAAATFAVATAYARALGASLGLGQDFCGPFAKQQRMFFLTVGTLAGLFRSHLPTWMWPSHWWSDAFSRSPVTARAPLLYWALVLIAAGTLITFVRRIVRIYRRLP